MTQQEHPKLAQIRALLAKAEATQYPEEAEALTAKAVEFMAKYGVDEALLSDGQPSRDGLTDRYFDLPNPWSMSRVRLVAFIAEGVGCRAVHQGHEVAGGGRRVHVIGYESDVQRAEILYTSLVLQMLNGLNKQVVPFGVRSAKAWRNSWQLGFIERVVERLKAIEDAARAAASGETSATGRSGELVLADRAAAVQAVYRKAHPDARTQRGTYTGSGYGDGAAAGNRADIGGTRRIGAASAASLVA
ncbi:DUF2786 domain-containing protein [Streptomyces sp. CBMA123]|uniref:DUF2786 domain-containing protein n=1 Tax=Streptomyces sp. CBMA123 TaxID=1896313 RepID=UPI00166200B8|nr:DUF2786 domain-containing protein [Streptomyces sp. CBMA123]MBD0689347.1 hypothetical protein [Streptomyces sp. CBMA123]